MARFPTDYAYDEAQALDLDTGFSGVDNRLDPSLLRTSAGYADVNRQILGPGMVADAINARFIAGRVECRRGWDLLTGYSFIADSVRTYLAQGILGAGRYEDAAGREWLVLVGRGSRVCFVAEGHTPRFICLPYSADTGKAGLWEELYEDADEAEVEVRQIGSQLMLLRRDDRMAYLWSGDWKDGDATPGNDPEPEKGFVPVPEPTEGNGRTRIPSSLVCTVFADRLWVRNGTDEVVASDILNYTEYDAAVNSFRFGAQWGDEIVAVSPFQQNVLAVFLRNSVWLLRGVVGDLSETFAENINQEIGCIARKSVAQVGADLFWLSSTGVHRLSQTDDSRMLVPAAPVSEPIEGYIQRINWTHAHKAAAVTDGRYYRLAVPMDGQTEPTHTLVYDTVLGTWQGYDLHPQTIDSTADLYHTRWWVKAPSRGRMKAVALSGPQCGTVGTLPRVIDQEGALGDYGNDLYLPFSMRTRGYLFHTGDHKTLRAIRLALETVSPRYSISVRTDKALSSKPVVTARTKSRTASTRFGGTAYTLTNANDDAARSDREDFTVMVADSAIPKTNGIAVRRPQSHTEGFLVRATGRWVALELSNDRGWLALKAVEGEAAGSPPAVRYATA